MKASRALPALSMAEAQLTEKQQQQPHPDITSCVATAAAAPAAAHMSAAAQASEPGTAACLVSADEPAA